MAKTIIHHCTCSKGSKEKRLGSTDVVRICLASMKVMICKQFNQSLESFYLRISFSWCSWRNIQLPWGPLDEDGNEEEFEDTVSLSIISVTCIDSP